MASILIDALSLSRLGTGMGQFCLHLGRELSLLQDGWFHPVFLMNHDSAEFLGRGVEKEVVGFLRQRLPYFAPTYDLWHNTHQDAPFFPNSPKTRFLLTIHDLHFLKELPLKEGEVRLKRVQKMVDRADAITVISRHTEREVRALLTLGSKPLYHIYNGLNQVVGPLQTAGSGDRPAFLPKGEFLLTMGVIEPRKNLHVLIDFLAGLPSYHLVMAGDSSHPYASEIKKRAVEAKVQERLIMPGEVFGATKGWLYDNCSAFLFPSRLEGFGMPILEAMSFGKPLFLSESTSVPEIGGPEAYYWTDFDPVKMKMIFNRGMEDFGSHREMKIASEKRWAQRFSWRTAAKEYHKIYMEIVGRP